MNELLDIEIILTRKRYAGIYNLGIIILGIIGIFIILAGIYDYRTYVVLEARVTENNELELLVRSDEVKYIISNSYLMIEQDKYQYVVKRIGDEILSGNDGKIYQYVYIDVGNISKIKNYIYQIRVLKEEKKLIKYLKDYL